VKAYTLHKLWYVNRCNSAWKTKCSSRVEILQNRSLLFIDEFIIQQNNYCMVMFEMGFGKQNSGFSLERLKRLIEVKDAGYILKAAKGNTTTANLISRQIGELETFFEVRLRQKDGKLKGLSPAGEELAEITNSFLSSLQNFKDKQDGIAPRITIGAGETFLSNILLPCFAKLMDSTEGNRISLSNQRSSALVDSLDSGKVDLIIVSERRLGKNEQKKILGKVDYKLYAPITWVQEIKKHKPLNAISTLPYAALSGSGERKSFVEAQLSNIGKSPNYELECSSHIELSEAVRSGCFCAVLPTFLGKSLDPREHASFTFPELKGMQANLCIAWRKEIYNYKPRIDFVINAIEKIVKDFLKSKS